MDKLRLCLNSQTPLVRFKVAYNALLEKYGDLPDPLPLEMLSEGEDYEFTPGGVPIMLYPLLQRLMAEGKTVNPHWIALNPAGPERVVSNGITMHSIQLGHHELASYTHCKEMIWQETHNLNITPLDMREFAAFAKYNWLCTEKMLEILPEVDAFYIHDFQQLQVGAMIGLVAPAVFRWHIPLQLDKVSRHVGNFILRGMEGFDAVVVSCKRDLEGLIRSGYRGKAHQIYPFVDQGKWTSPEDEEIEGFRRRFSLGERDRLIAVVARMDGMKGQDTAIEALARVADGFPDARLVLVGNGSFSGSKRGGLAHPKSEVWRSRLEAVAKELGVRDRITFTGYLSQGELRSLYHLSEIAVLPSIREGFGLTVVEAWLYEKPVVVSTGAGSSELVIDGVNGFTFAPRNSGELADKVQHILKDPARGREMGMKGYDTSRRCWIERGAEAVFRVLKETAEEFRR